MLLEWKKTPVSTGLGLLFVLRPRGRVFRSSSPRPGLDIEDIAGDFCGMERLFSTDKTEEDGLWPEK
jgi:hypothetical protein